MHIVTLLRVQQQYAHLKIYLTKRHTVWGVGMDDFGFCGYGDFLGIHTGFSAGTEWVIKVKVALWIFH